VARRKTTGKTSIKQSRRKVPVKEKTGPRDFSGLWSRDVGLQKSELRILRYLVIGVTLLMSVLSTGVGLNGDDDVQAQYSTDLPAFYTSFGQDTSCFNSGPEIKYYGALFELITGLNNAVLGLDKDEPGYYQVRHVWSAVFGGITIYFLVLLVGQIAGFRASLLSMAFMFLTMRFLGHSLFNPKDIPFAAGYMVSLYFIYQTLRSLPEVSRSTLLGLAAGIAMSVGVRIGGVLVIAYLGIFLAGYFIAVHGLGQVFRPMARPYYRAFFIPVLIGMAGALVVWPFGLLNPFQNIPRALDAFAHFQYAIKVLFEGRLVWSSDIPVEYLLTWMGLTIPVFTWVGLVLFLIFIRRIFKRYNPVALILSIFGFAFPIVYVLASGSILYDGWRHFLFTYAPLVFLVSLGWLELFHVFSEKQKWTYAVWVMVGLSMVDSAVFLFRNPAYPYVYFNPLVGGIKGAYGDFELDYWGASVKQAVEALEEEGILSAGMQDTVVIGSNFSHAAQVYTKKYGDLVKVNYVRWRQRNDRPWDYGIFVNRFVDGSYLKGGYWPTSKTIRTIRANDVPIAIIERDGVESDAYLAAQAVVRQDWDAVILHAEGETQAHPDNEMGWISLGMAWLNKNDMLKAKIPLDRALEIVPDNQNALNFMGYYYFATDNLNEAYATFSKAVELHQTNITAYYYLGRIRLMQNNYTEALQYAQDGINVNPQNPQCYQLAAEIYRVMGDAANAQRYLSTYNQLMGN
jgi:hypothetical protein